MRTLTFAKRCAREILRDPVNIGFGLGFPIVLLLLFSAIQSNLPETIFDIAELTPGIVVFGLSFITLFSATLLSKDRESAFLQRLYTTPMREVDYILGYMLPLLPIALLQAIICYVFASLLGLKLDVGVVYALIGIIPIAIFNISLGLLCGSVLGVKQVSGICGALLTNLTAWLSGAWFDLSLVGGFVEGVAKFLPFLHAVEMEKALFCKDITLALVHLVPILLFSALTLVLAVLFFIRQMKRR